MGVVALVPWSLPIEELLIHCKHHREVAVALELHANSVWRLVMYLVWSPGSCFFGYMQCGTSGLIMQERCACIIISFPYSLQKQKGYLSCRTMCMQAD